VRGPFDGLPVAVTSPGVYLALAAVAVALFLLFNGASLRVRIHSPLAAMLAVGAFWFAPPLLYAFGSTLLGRSSSVMRVDQSERWIAGRQSSWMLSLREPGSVQSYDFRLSGPRAFRSVNLADVPVGACLRVSTVRLPRIVAVYDAASVACPAASYRY